MTTRYTQEGAVINVSATAGCTAGTIYAGDSLAGVYLQTYSAASTNTACPVALEGVFKFTTGGAGATVKFAVLDKVYATTSGVITNSSSSTKPLGAAVNSTTSGGGETLYVKLCSF